MLVEVGVNNTGARPRVAGRMTGFRDFSSKVSGDTLTSLGLLPLIKYIGFLKVGVSLPSFILSGVRLFVSLSPLEGFLVGGAGARLTGLLKEFVPSTCKESLALEANKDVGGAGAFRLGRIAFLKRPSTVECFGESETSGLRSLSETTDEAMLSRGEFVAEKEKKGL